MNKHRRESKPSKFDVALEKGDYQLPKDLAPTAEQKFEHDLSAFITFWKYLGLPNETIMYRILIWEDHEHDRVATAQAIGLSGREAVRQMIKHLKEKFDKSKKG